MHDYDSLMIVTLISSLLSCTTCVVPSSSSTCIDFPSTIYHRKKQVHAVQPLTLSSTSSSSSSGYINGTTMSGGCKNCSQITHDNRQIIRDLESAIHDLEQENQGLTAKLSDMTRVFHSLRREQQRQQQQLKSPTVTQGSFIKNTSRSSSSDRNSSQQPLHDSRQSTTNTTESTSGHVLLPPNELSHNRRVNSPSDTGVSSSGSTDLPEGSHASESRRLADQNARMREGDHARRSSSKEPSSSSSSIRDEDNNNSSSRSICSSSCSPDRKMDDVIFGLRKQIIVLKKQVQDKETAYQDLLQKYNDRKEQHKESIKRMRSVLRRFCRQRHIKR